MEVFLLHLINGITLGAMYALVALGLSLIFGVVRLVNFAHGDLFMLGGYMLILFYTDNEVPYALSIVLAVISMALVGVIFERIVVRPVIERSWRVQLIVTLAASIILSNLAIHIWGTTPQEAPTNLSRLILRLGPINVVYQRLLLVAIAVACFIGLNWFTRRTKIGKAMRAMSQNREACVVFGIDIKKVSVVTLAISSGLAGLAGTLITPLYNVSPTVGSVATLKALAAVIMGGLGQASGAIYAALILGVTESLFGGYVSFAFRDAAAFLVMVLVLLFRPHGLFGKKVGI